MTCEAIRLPDGTVALVKLGRVRQKRCSVCRSPAGLLCDYPVRGHTCDKPLCESCAIHKNEDTDWCPDHPPVPVLKLL